MQFFSNGITTMQKFLSDIKLIILKTYFKELSKMNMWEKEFKLNKYAIFHTDVSNTHTHT